MSFWLSLKMQASHARTTMLQWNLTQGCQWRMSEDAGEDVQATCHLNGVPYPAVARCLDSGASAEQSCNAAAAGSSYTMQSEATGLRPQLFAFLSLQQGVHTVPIAKRMTVYQSDILQAPAEEDAAGASEPATSPGADEPALPLAGRPKGLQAAHEKAKRSKRKQEAGNVAETAHAPVPAADQVQHKQKKRKKRRSEETGLQADDSQKEGAADLGKKKVHYLSRAVLQIILQQAMRGPVFACRSIEKGRKTHMKQL